MSETPMNYDLDALDMEIIDEARSILKARWPEMIDGYVQDTHMYIENIKQAIANDDKQALADHAHPLKSSSQGMGLVAVGEIAHAIEHDARQAMEEGGDVAHLQELVPLLEEALQRGEAKLRATIEDAA